MAVLNMYLLLLPDSANTNRLSRANHPSGMHHAARAAARQDFSLNHAEIRDSRRSSQSWWVHTSGFEDLGGEEEGGGTGEGLLCVLV